MATSDQVVGLGSIRFTSWNVRGLGGPIKRARVFSHLKSLKSEVIFLQETHLRISDHTRLRKPWVGQTFHSGFNSHSRGTAILLHKRLQFSPEQIISDPNGRYFIIVGMLLNTPVILASVYAPNWECPSFMTTLFSQLPSLDSHHLIFFGDLNLTIDPTLDRSNSKNLSLSNMAKAFISLTDQIGCVDAWRFFHPRVKHFSFYSPVHHTYSHINNFFVDKILAPSVKSCEYSTIVISDHAPILMDLELFSRPKHSLWRLNVELLSSDAFCKFVTEKIYFFYSNQQIRVHLPLPLVGNFKSSFTR